jgi:hypothetical protein
MAEQDTSEHPASRLDSEAPDRPTQADARAEPARPEAAAASGGRDDDRNEESAESPVPDPEATDGDAEDVPEAD